MTPARPTLTVAAAATAVLLAGAVPAGAAQIDVAVGPSDAALGAMHGAQGTMRTDAGAPLAGRRISLQVRPYPYTGAWRAVDHATTSSRGAFAFDGIALDRNADVRVVAFDGTTSGIARAFTYPSHRLAYRSLSRRRVRLTQTYRTPRDVRLTRPTRFYIARGTAASAPVTARRRTRRTAPGRFRSTVTVRLPKRWHGSFRYASCFTYSPRSGMGDPAQGCPRRYRF
jgi:hypothetical protein